MNQVATISTTENTILSLDRLTARQMRNYIESIAASYRAELFLIVCEDSRYGGYYITSSQKPDVLAEDWTRFISDPKLRDTFKVSVADGGTWGGRPHSVSFRLRGNRYPEQILLAA